MRTLSTRRQVAKRARGKTERQIEKERESTKCECAAYWNVGHKVLWPAVSDEDDDFVEWPSLLPAIFLCFAFGPQTQKRVSLLPLSSAHFHSDSASVSRLHSSSQQISVLLLVRCFYFYFLPALKFLWLFKPICLDGLQISCCCFLTVETERAIAGTGVELCSAKNVLLMT